MDQIMPTAYWSQLKAENSDRTWQTEAGNKFLIEFSKESKFKSEYDCILCDLKLYFKYIYYMLWIISLILYTNVVFYKQLSYSDNYKVLEADKMLR